ncbi:GNAT family N-acetyltransferase [Porticoccaceae bacterium LTM1]|nr:GNAT family N-acetyltransferase [Porticoccaceae bacterium LTM1]
MNSFFKANFESASNQTVIAERAPLPSELRQSRLPRAVRTAWDTEAPLVASILGAALRNDPVMKWVMNDPKEVWNYFYWMHQKLFAQYDLVHMSRDGKGAAMWLPPMTTEQPVNLVKLFGLSLTILKTGGYQGFKHYLSIRKSFEQHHPHEPHYYLHAIGVRPDFRGRGIGSLLLQEVIERSDRERVKIYTENTCERSLPFLQRHGFRVIAKESLPDGGPTVWFMERLPKHH